MNDKNAKNEIETLRAELKRHAELYYEQDAPEISDREYDLLLRRLQQLESEYPQFRSADSPSERVGGTPSSSFEKVTHEIKLESLQDSFSLDEVKEFCERAGQNAAQAFTVEPKIDGLSVCLEYENGVFVRGSTRGNGEIGEDVSENLRTVKGIPQRVKTDCKKLIVRGEVYMPKNSFAEIVRQQTENGQTPFKNPRNAAAGSLRQKDSGVTAERQLEIFVFDLMSAGDGFERDSDCLEYLRDLGFKMLPFYKLCDDFVAVRAEIERIGSLRAGLAYDIDGAVVKIDSLKHRAQLGSTNKFPRWATAFKYPPEVKQTALRDIEIAVGRTGVLTPTAVFEPILLAGTTVSRAVLHNEDYIAQLDLRVGDTIEVHKAGDIIPEVVRSVAHAENSAVFSMPHKCPSCGEQVVHLMDESALRCVNPECPEQLRRNLIHFVSKAAMNIEGLGPSTIDQLLERKLVGKASDLYVLTKQQLLTLDKIKDKAAQNILDAVAASKGNSLERLVFALGIRNVGEKAAALLARRFGNMDALAGAAVAEMSRIDGIGPVIADSAAEFFARDGAKDLIERLRQSGVNMVFSDSAVSSRLAGYIFVVTGTLEHFSRSEIEKLIADNGGKAAASVSKKTSYVVAGAAAGSKLDKARQLGVPVLSESEFEKMLEQQN